jgi:hypothetical protein
MEDSGMIWKFDHVELYEIGYIEELEARCRQQAARIKALEVTLQEIEWHDPKSPAAATARAALGAVDDLDLEEGTQRSSGG